MGSEFHRPLVVEMVVPQISIEPFNISKACPNALDGTPLV